MKTFTYEDEDDVRLAFWRANPQWPVAYEKWERGYTQNCFNAEIRTTFCEFVDHLQKSGEISNDLADSVTL